MQEIDLPFRSVKKYIKEHMLWEPKMYFQTNNNKS